METGWEVEYYLNQAGTGFAPFSGLRYQKGNGFSPYTGVRYQRGNGFLGRLWKGITLPLLKYIGRQGIEAAGNIVREVSENPSDVKDVIKKEAKRLAGKAIEDGGKRLSTYVQTGKGAGKLVYETHVNPGSNKRRANITESKNTTKKKAIKQVKGERSKASIKHTFLSSK